MGTRPVCATAVVAGLLLIGAPRAAAAQSSGGGFEGSLGGLAVVLIAFLILREVVLWYWKVNKIVGLLERIEERQRALAELALKRTEADVAGRGGL